MLKFENVTKVYNDNKVVENLNFEIKKGEFTVVIGPSGCGKSTTLKMINRMIEPSDGRILLEGKNIINSDPVKLRRSIGYVIQQIGLFPHMTIRENIGLVPKLLKWPEEKKQNKINELMKLINLDLSYLERYPHELSGGQQQRIGVLRALAAEASLILMDEPFGALDPITRDALQDEFKRLQNNLKKTIIFVTHDMDEAIKLADNIIILNDGEVVQTGSPDEILQAPANRFVEEFIGKDRLTQNRPTVRIVDQIMSKTPVTITEDGSLWEAIQIMREKRVDSLLVIDKKRKLKGYIDVQTVDEYHRKDVLVGEIMDCDIETVQTGALLKNTVLRILHNSVSYVPVVNQEDQLLGIVTRASLADLVYDSIWGENREQEDLKALV